MRLNFQRSRLLTLINNKKLDVHLCDPPYDFKDKVDLTHSQQAPLKKKRN